VIGSWHGAKQPDSRWAFTGYTPLAADLVGFYAPPPNTEPLAWNELSSTRCTILTKAVIPYLIGKVGYTLARRSLANNGGGGYTNTGYDMVLGANAFLITSRLCAKAASGQALSYQIRTSGTATSYSATGLPAGLVIDTTTGLITGTRTTGGDVNVTIGASDATHSSSATLVIKEAYPWSGGD
jgi:hypothetical protein